MRKILCRATGGLGKMISFTGVIRQLREENKDATIHVMTPYPDVFSNIKFIDKFYPFPGPNAFLVDFYEHHAEFEILESEPYFDLNYRQKKEHLVDVWARQFNLRNPKSKAGHLELSQAEKAWAANVHHQFNLGGRKLVAFQPFGGTSFYSAESALDITRPRQVRDLHPETAQKVADELNKLGFVVLQISLPTEPQLNGTVKLPIPQNQVMNPRFVFALLSICDSLVAIDSFAAHAWAGLGKEKAVVLWGATSPVNLGYNGNTHLQKANSCQTPNCGRPHGFLLDLTGDGKPWQCPLNGPCMNFDAVEVAQAALAHFGG